LTPFEWDPGKARENVRKHPDITFEEASTVLNDPLSVTILDPGHSRGEVRYLIMGYSAGRRLLVVSYTERQDRIRIISARLATRKERRSYEEG
jgi:uncharacterized DUF497 family protein